jgi:ABC-type multidrug transport system fused ATPase/permease subunit
MENIVFIVGHVKKYIWWLSGAIAATLALVGVQLVAPWVIRELINTVTSSAQGEADLGRITQLTILILGVYFSEPYSAL